MKTIGLIGGMSWESTVGYYQHINRGIKHRLGGLHSAKIVMVSVDFAEIERLQHSDDWQGCASILSDAARQLQRAGVDGVIICTNTMHKVAPQVQAAIDVPLLHIADATAARLLAAGVQKVGLLGTAFTMEQAFYKGRLFEQGLDVVIPNDEDRAIVHRVIYDELCQGTLLEASRQSYYDIIDRLAGDGAEAVILGCTEIGLLVSQDKSRVSLYDTTEIHAEAAVEFMLAGDKPNDRR